MSKTSENIGFVCEQCGSLVKPLTNGSYRNHCPYCLYSKHVDEKNGDRKSVCKGLMKPADIIYHSKKGFQIVHECFSCGHIQKNIIAENTVQEDDILSFMQLRSKR